MKEPIDPILDGQSSTTKSLSDPTRSHEQKDLAFDSHRCPQCQQPNHCDIANGQTSCWCFDLAVRDLTPKTSDQKAISASCCLCRQCLNQLPK